MFLFLCTLSMNEYWLYFQSMTENFVTEEKAQEIEVSVIHSFMLSNELYNVLQFCSAFYPVIELSSLHPWL